MNSLLVTSFAQLHQLQNFDGQYQMKPKQNETKITLIILSVSITIADSYSCKQITRIRKNLRVCYFIFTFLVG